MSRKLAYIYIILCALFVLYITLARATTLVSVGNNIVRDTDGNLEWIDHPFSSRSWTDQTDVADALTYNGTSDWRLPTRTELLTLVNSTHDPKIDPLFHLGNVSNWSCWTSTAVTDRAILRRLIDKSRAYFVFFGNGRVNHAPKKSHYPALFVRSFATIGWKWNNGSYINWNNGEQMELNND